MGNSRFLRGLDVGAGSWGSTGDAAARRFCEDGEADGAAPSFALEGWAGRGESAALDGDGWAGLLLAGDADAEAGALAEAAAADCSL